MARWKGRWGWPDGDGHWRDVTFTGPVGAPHFRSIGIDGGRLGMEINEITGEIIGGAIEVHRELGPGLLESTYRACLVLELIQRGLHVESEKTIPVVYKGKTINCGYRIDLFVNQSVIVEIKVVDRFAPIHSAQLLTYLKLTRCRVGLLINFNVPLLRQGLRRYLLDP